MAVFPADATDPAAAHLFNGLAADALLIMFTLSAVPPQQQVGGSLAGAGAGAEAASRVEAAPGKVVVVFATPKGETE